MYRFGMISESRRVESLQIVFSELYSMNHAAVSLNLKALVSKYLFMEIGKSNNVIPLSPNTNKRKSLFSCCNNH